MRKSAMLFAAAFVATGLTVDAQVPIRRGDPARKPTPVVTPRTTIVLPDRTPRIPTAVRDIGTTWKVRIRDHPAIASPGPGQGETRRPRIRVNWNNVRRTDGAPLPVVVPGATPRARVVEELRDPAKVFVGHVGDEQMSLKELRRRVNLALRGRKFSGALEKVQAARAKLERAYERRILGDWIDTKLLVKEARERGIEVSDKEIDAYIERTAEDRAVRVPIAQQMQAMGLSEQDLRKTMEEAILGDKLVRLVIHDRVPDKDLREKYDTMPELFVAPPARHAIQIFYPCRGTETPTQIQNMDARMQKIRRNLKWFKAKFEDYADPTGSEPVFVSDLGWLEFGEPTLPQRQFLYYIIFATAPTGPGSTLEYKLKLNEISDVIQSRYGYHIVKVIEERPALRRSFEEARIQIEDLFYNKVRKQLLEELKVKHQPRYDLEGLTQSTGANRMESTRQSPTPRNPAGLGTTGIGDRASSPPVGFGLDTPPSARSLLSIPRPKR